MNNKRPVPQRAGSRDPFTRSRPDFAKSILPLLVLIIAILGCKPSSTSNAPAANKKAETAEKPKAKETPPPTSSSRFDVAEICSLPKEIAPGTPYGRLGGGSWARTSTDDEEWDYECDGDTSDIKTEDSEKGTVVLEYGAIGGPDDVKYLSVEYTATRFGGLDKSEMEHRKGYVDFVDKISKRLFREPLPETVKSQLLGSKNVKKEDSGTPVGTGYVNTSVNFAGNKSVSMDIHFYESGESYERNKDK